MWPMAQCWAALVRMLVGGQDSVRASSLLSRTQACLCWLGLGKVEQEPGSHSWTHAKPAVCRSSRGNSLELKIWFSSSSTFSYSWGSPTHMELRRIRSGTVMGSSNWMSCLMCESWAVDFPGPPAAPLSPPENQIRSSYKAPPSRCPSASEQSCN